MNHLPEEAAASVMHQSSPNQQTVPHVSAAASSLAVRKPFLGSVNMPRSPTDVGKVRRSSDHVHPGQMAHRQLPVFQGATAKKRDEEAEMRPPGPFLPHDYRFGQKDVCSGRGKKHWNLPGNCTYRGFIQDRVLDYIAAPTKRDKTVFISDVVRTLRNDGYQFLKEDRHGRLFDMGDKEAREKVAHCLRDQVTAIRAKTRPPGLAPQQRAGVDPTFYGKNQFPVRPVRPVPSEPDGTLIDYWIQLS